MELYFKYYEEVNRENEKIADENRGEKSDEDDETESENYLRLLEHGLFALQSICYIILDISGNGPSGISKRLGRLLNLRNEPKANVVDVVKTYWKNLGEERLNMDKSVFQEEQERIEGLIDKFEKL
jgi:beta-catenin-like protein 1